jgi:hypothetical protein
VRLTVSARDNDQQLIITDVDSWARPRRNGNALDFGCIPASIIGVEIAPERLTVDHLYRK